MKKEIKNFNNYFRNENYMGIFLTLISSLLFIIMVKGAYFLVWIVLVPLLVAIYKKTVGFTLMLVSLFSLTSITIGFFWVHNYEPTLYLYPLVIAYFFSFFIIFFLVSKILSKKIDGLFFVLVPPAIWSTLQFFYSLTIFGGYPFDWSVYHLTTAPLIWFVGSKGITYLIILFNSILSFFILKRSRKPLIFGLILLLVMISCFLYSNSAKVQGEKIKVGLIQGDFPEQWKWRQRHVNDIAHIYENLTFIAAKENPDFIIWPEYALPADIVNFHHIKSRKFLFDAVSDLAKYTNSTLILGSLLYNKTINKSEDVALIFSPEKGYEGYYAAVVPAFFNKGVVPGKKEPEVFDLSSHKLGISICYEETIPELSRSLVNKGAEFLIFLSNNQNFTDGYRHAAGYSKLRAAENKKFIVRVTNDGITQIVNPYGKIIIQSEKGERNVLVGEIFLNNEKTFYTKYGDVILLLVLVLTLFFIIIHLKRRI